MTASANPLCDPSPAEVPLPRAPLVRVIGQLRFPLIASIEQRHFIAPFQEKIRWRYPYLNEERAQNVLVGPGQAMPLQQELHWRFQDSDEDWSWRTTLASTFVAVETNAYESRASFMERLSEVVEALFEVVKPGVIERIGVRYVDRVCAPEMARIDELVRPELLGVLGTDFASQLTHAISESHIQCADARQLLARWGLVPAGATVDPSVPPIAEPSWILDIDVSRHKLGSVEAADALAIAEGHAERAYAFFRWAVTSAFLTTYGAQRDG